MPIEWNRVRTVTAREIVRALARDNFFIQRQSGSHQIYRHPDGRRVTLSFHRGGETFKMDTLRSIIEGQALWTEDDLRRLGLL